MLILSIFFEGRQLDKFAATINFMLVSNKFDCVNCIFIPMKNKNATYTFMKSDIGAYVMLSMSLYFSVIYSSLHQFHMKSMPMNIIYILCIIHSNNMYYIFISSILRHYTVVIKCTRIAQTAIQYFVYLRTTYNISLNLCPTYRIYWIHLH